MTEIVPEIIECVSEETDASVEDLPPLRDAIDGDALESIVDDCTYIEFEYANHTIEITDGDVSVQP